MTMVERVAKAMAENAGFDWAACAQSQWRSDARAAIAAMREPSEAMCKVYNRRELDGTEPRDIWQAMVDEALKG